MLNFVFIRKWEEMNSNFEEGGVKRGNRGKFFFVWNEKYTEGSGWVIWSPVWEGLVMIHCGSQ